MPKPRVPAAPTTAAQRHILFETWQHTGNVALACRTANVGRRTFYYWKPRFESGGFAALEDVQSSAPKRPHRIPDAVVEQVLTVRRAHPTWGKRRIARAVAGTKPGMPPLSATTVERLLTASGLWTGRAASNRSTSPVPASQGDARPLPLLATKFARPRMPTSFVERERLLRELDVALRHRLTLVSAAAGWGKTTLLSAWAARHTGPVAWLSLDEMDNDATRFWSAVIAALRTALPALGATALAMLHSPAPASTAAVVTTLLAELSAVAAPAPLVLMLDDLHVVDDPAVYAEITRLIEQLPPQLHVVLATRVDPQLPLARWRVRGDLVELRAAALGFTPDEAGALFVQAVGDQVADEHVHQLQQRTEGWIAGLHLAALALRQRTDHAAFVQAFTGSHRYVLDYVQEEILARQPPAVQRFMLRTAVLRRMTAPLCAAVTAEADSQALLETLERGNLFVVPLDDTRQWYRMHDLVREVLLARLAATEPTAIPELHRHAAHWYAAHDELPEAITHALAADDGAYAATLIARAAPQLWLRGEATTVQAWIGALSDAVVQQHARLALDAALRVVELFHGSLADTFRTVHADAERTMSRVEAQLDAYAAAERAVLERRIGLLRALLATRAALTSNDVEQMRTLADHSAALAADEHGSWQLIALWIRCWLVESLEREGVRLIPQLLEAKQQLIDAGYQAETLRVMRWLAFIYTKAGTYRRAEAESLAALRMMEQIGQYSAAAGYFHLYLVWAYAAFNQRDKAARAVDQLLAIANTWQHVDLLVMGTMERMVLALANGDHGGAEQSLLAIEALLDQERLATHTSPVETARAYYWLATGNFAAARAWAEQVVFSPDTWHPNRNWEFLVRIQVELAQGHYARALALLDELRPYLDRAGDIATTLEFLPLEVVALHGAGKPTHAHTVLLRLLHLTADDNNIRAFLDAGEPMRRALEQLRAPPHEQHPELPAAARAFVAKILAAFAHEPPRAGLTASLDTTSVSQLGRTPTFPEPLTRREQEVLRLLLAGATNPEIAADLIISVATAKKHVSNLLAKLQVASRKQAIARARDWPELG